MLYLLYEATNMHSNEFFVALFLFDSVLNLKVDLFLKMYVIRVYTTFKNVVTKLEGFNIISIY